MNHKEKNLSNTLKGYFLQEKFFVDKIESRLTTAGIPDLLVLTPSGQQNFIELKVVEEDMKINLTPGQVSWHSKRRMRHNSTPFIIYIEPIKKIIVATSLKVLDLIEKGGKIDLDQIPEECFFSRSAKDYALLSYAATDLYYTSPRVYK